VVSVARAKGDFALVTALQQRLGGVPVTRRLLVTAAVAVVGLMATSALEETAAGGWFNVPWDGSGLGQPGKQGQPTTGPPPIADLPGNHVGQRRSHATPRRHGHQPKVRPPPGAMDLGRVKGPRDGRLLP
jgi:hypothetical protein